MTKACTTCQRELPIEQFYKHTQTKDGRHRQCRECVLAVRKESYRQNPTPKREQSRRRNLAKFGLTEADYDILLAGQGGRCHICQKKPSGKRLAVDHDHRTGLVRGLLCTHCNHHLLGIFHDNDELFERAANYIRFPPAPGVLGERRVADAPPVDRPRYERPYPKPLPPMKCN